MIKTNLKNIKNEQSEFDIIVINWAWDSVIQKYFYSNNFKKVGKGNRWISYHLHEKTSFHYTSDHYLSSKV